MLGLKWGGGGGGGVDEEVVGGSWWTPCVKIRYRFPVCHAMF